MSSKAIRISETNYLFHYQTVQNNDVETIAVGVEICNIIPWVKYVVSKGLFRT